RRRARLQRCGEERPRQKTHEQEDRVGLLARRGHRPRAQHDAEQEPEDDELEQRADEVPGEPEDGALVAGAQLAPGEVGEELAPVDERAQVRDHGGRVFGSACSAGDQPGRATVPGHTWARWCASSWLRTITTHLLPLRARSATSLRYGSQATPIRRTTSA